LSSAASRRNTRIQFDAIAVRLGVDRFQPPANPWRRSAHRRRWAAAMRALPSAVRGGVL